MLIGRKTLGGVVRSARSELRDDCIERAATFGERGVVDLAVRRDHHGEHRRPLAPVERLRHRFGSVPRSTESL